MDALKIRDDALKVRDNETESNYVGIENCEVTSNAQTNWKEIKDR
jgi:hypothetical protein